MRHCLLLVLALGAGLTTTGTRLAAADDPRPDPAQVEFFEKNVRPILAGRCFECHGPDKQRGGLRLDSRAALLEGGDSGPAITPGQPEKSRLIQAIHHTDKLRMPPKDKLSAEHVSALTAWVKMGAPWPAATAEVRSAPKSGFRIAAQDRAFWSFRPVTAAGCRP